jgi:hypothetical protein
MLTEEVNNRELSGLILPDLLKKGRIHMNIVVKKLINCKKADNNTFGDNFPVFI